MSSGLMSGKATDDAAGPSASIEQGQAGPVNQMANSLKNQAPGAYAAAQEPQAQPGGQPPPQGQPQQQGQPQPQLQQPGQPPTQGSPDQQGGQRLNMSAVFPPMPGVNQMNQKPWRQQLRTWAYHPDAGPALTRLADLIQHQSGPKY